MGTGGSVLSKKVGGATLGKIVLLGLWCCLVSSCGEAAAPIVPQEPLPPPSLLDLFGNVFYQADETEVGIDAIEQKAIIGIYFGAGWCSACAGFTPLLVSFYEELEQTGKSFEIVFVSFDGTADEMFTHMTDRGMPWLAVPTGGDKADQLTVRYDVASIPTLVVIDNDRNTITTGGRADVVVIGAAAYEDWLAASGG